MGALKASGPGGSALQDWARQPLALLHGEDADGRREAVEAWKAVHVDPEWEAFSLSVCSENAPWAEVLNALSEAAPFGAVRVVVVPQADPLLAKPKDTPAALLRYLDHPIPDTRLLLVARTALSAASGKALGAKPWNAWAKAGRVLKVGTLEKEEIPAFIEAQARSLGLRLEGGVAALLASRVGGHPGILRRTLEVLDLMAEGRPVTAELVDGATFRMAEQNAFAWSQAWQKGQADRALLALRQAVEDDPGGAPLLLLGQARREVERLCRLLEAQAAGLGGSQELAAALGLTGFQVKFLGDYQRVLGRVKGAGVQKLLGLVNQTDRDLKGLALGSSAGPLAALTLDLCRAWKA